MKMDKNKLYIDLAIINRVCMAFFQNSIENKGVLLCQMEPEFPDIIGMRKIYFDPTVQEYPYTKSIYHGKAIIENKNLNSLSDLKVENFFDDDFKKELEKCADDFVDKLKKYPDSDVIFSMLPEVIMYPSIFCTDSYTHFSARLLYSGEDFITNKTSLIFEFHAHFMFPVRKIIDEERPDVEIWGVK